MARQKEFDVELALDNAMQLFWKKGYEQTSLNDLLDAMGIGRASFYNAFNDKHTLFIKALTRYLKMANEQFMVVKLTEMDSPYAGIKAIFYEEIDFLAQDDNQKGCMMVNCEIELMHNDDEAKTLIIESLGKVETALADAITRAIDADEIAPTYAVDDLVAFLLNSMRGIKALARHNNNRRELRAIADITLAALNPQVD